MRRALPSRVGLSALWRATAGDRDGRGSAPLAVRQILATHRAAEPLGPGPPGGASAIIAGTASGLPAAGGAGPRRTRGPRPAGESWLRTVLIFQLALSFARGHYYSPT